jgi:chromosome segregation ATPase
MSVDGGDRDHLAGEQHDPTSTQQLARPSLEVEEDKSKHEDVSDASSDIANNLAALTDSRQKAYVEGSKPLRRLQRLAERLSRYNIEGIGITPLKLEQRIGTQWWSPGLIWFSANVNGESL